MSHTDDLKRAVDYALIDGMRPGLKAAIDAALALGQTHAVVLAEIRAITGGPHAQPGGLTYLATEAYLESLAKGE